MSWWCWRSSLPCWRHVAGEGAHGRRIGRHGDTASAAATGNATNGEALFKQSVIGQNPGCATCHSLDGSQLVGPSLQGIATRAGTRVQGQSAEQYIHTSMVDPDAFVVEGFTKGVMPSFKDALNDQQLNDLIAFLMTQK